MCAFFLYLVFPRIDTLVLYNAARAEDVFRNCLRGILQAF